MTFATRIAAIEALKATHRSALAQQGALNAQAAAAGVCGGVVIGGKCPTQSKRLNFQGINHMTTDIQLPKVTQNRIARLAQASGRSPAATLRFVLRDGFDAVERSIQENANADAEFAAGATSTHADVLADAQKLVRQAKRNTRAAA